MEAKLSYSPVADVQSELLVLVALDHNTDKSKDAKPDARLASSAAKEAAADVLASGEITAKPFETTLIHAPRGLKAKRLLVIGGGKAAKFSANELRKIAGTAVRFAKGKSIHSLAIALPEGTQIDENVSSLALVEGSYVGDFDPNYYAIDRKD